MIFVVGGEILNEDLVGETRGEGYVNYIFASDAKKEDKFGEKDIGRFRAHLFR